MNQNYNDIIEQISQLLCKTIVEQEPNVEEKINQLDGAAILIITSYRLKSDVQVIDSGY